MYMLIHKECHIKQATINGDKQMTQKGMVASRIIIVSTKQHRNSECAAVAVVMLQDAYC